jgi:hypothetical protein
MRRYSAETTAAAKYFLGVEQFGKSTQGMKILGVVGYQPVDEIIEYAAKHQVQGILLGANRTFWVPSEIASNEEWDEQLMFLLTKTIYNVIVSMNVNDTGHFDFDKYYRYGRFHVQLFFAGVNVERLPPNTTLIIDDRMWEQNNRCLYSCDLSDIVKGENAVSWDDLATDVVIEKIAEG